MLISYRFVREISGIDVSPEVLADRLTFSGLEIDGIEKKGAFSDRIVVAEILSKAAHPSKDKLSVVEVAFGVGKKTTVVCGAPNCPGPGGRVVLAMLGATVGDVVLEPRKLGGVLSEGMLVSEAELGIGPDDDGILLLNGETDAPLGTPIATALDLEDAVLDVSITPNRPDALSHRGIAREACLLFKVPYEPKAKAPAPRGKFSVGDLASVEILDADLCPRYGAAAVVGVSWKPSPFALRYRLHNLGLRPISNLVDATNLLMMEYGQPIHAFDLDCLAEHRIVVRRARSGERMKTLDGQERVFVSDDLLICDGKGPVAIAGVMGGLDSGVTEKTTRVLIECAYFQPSSIRRTAKRLKLFTDAAYRFERGTDPHGIPGVMDAAAGLLVELAGGEQAANHLDCYPVPIKASRVRFRPSRYASLIGCEVSAEEAAGILTGLGAEVCVENGELDVTVPASRPDIEREVDLIEEVVRIKGFADVPETLPRLSCLKPERPRFESERRARELLASLGLMESVSYSFVHKELLQLLRLDSGVIDIANPLSSERASMQTTLLAGLVENLKRAHTRFLPGIAQFEVGRTFHDVKEELPKEIVRAAALLSGPKAGWVGETARPYDFYDIKGIVEAFMLNYSGMAAGFEPVSDVMYLHPKRACRVTAGGRDVGVMGELHPTILSKLKLPRGVQVFELDIFPLWENKVRSRATKLPEFPPMVRDSAFVVRADLDAGVVRDTLLAAVGPLAESVHIFDVYQGAHVPDGAKSLAFSVTYRAVDRTLTDEEIDGIHNLAILEVVRKYDAKIR